jgi:outer membrane usher protein
MSSLATLTTVAAHAGTPLYLDVTLNGVSRNLIGHFERAADGTVGASIDELKQIGLRAPHEANPDFVPLSALPGVNYAIDEHRQTIRFQTSVAALTPNEFDLAPLRGALRADEPPRRDFGAVLNYDFFAASSRDIANNVTSFNGASVSTEARIFGPYGTFTQTGIIGNTTTSSEFTGTRLDSTYTYVDESRDHIYRAGDLITGGLAWTRPVRLGGIQAERDFGLRPDLVTLPLPSVSGSAAVPSALNVYVNGVQTFSQQVPAGPFQLNNIPAVTGGGTTRIVLRDASGQTTQQEVPYFVSAKLLRGGLYDYSAEVGTVRLNYGASSFDYDDRPAASASGRLGVTDWLTLEGHGETTKDLGNVGGGADIRTGHFGVLSAAGAISVQNANHGALAYGAYAFQVWGLTFNLDSQRTIGAYRDLAAVTAPVPQASPIPATGSSSTLGQYYGVNGFLYLGSVLPPLAVDRISIGLPLWQHGASLNASFTNYVDASSTRSRIASLSYSLQLPYNGTFFATALRDFGTNKNTTILGGLSFPIGKNMTASTSAQSEGGSKQLTTQASKALDLQPGSYGWNLVDTEGSDTLRSASGNYRGSTMQAGAQVAQSNGSVTGNVTASGGMVLMSDSGVHFGPRINDSFAIVKAGAPDVPVQVENRPVGVTDSDGELLVTGLRSYDISKISIDDSNLPINASVERTKIRVSPANQMGTVVDFGVDVSAKSIIVHFVDKSGKDIPPGTEGSYLSRPFVVGYEGQAYLTGLSSQITATLQLADGSCTATIDADPTKLMQKIGPVTCR